MRPIKFRGKTKGGGWQYGYYVVKEKVLVAMGENNYDDVHYIFNTEFADWNMPRKLQMIEVDPESVGEFTNLTDKNGKEIYEGDILHKNGHRDREVVWSIDAWTHTPIVGKKETDQPYRLKGFIHNCEVIGNIYENPELLK